MSGLPPVAGTAPGSYTSPAFVRVRKFMLYANGLLLVLIAMSLWRASWGQKHLANLKPVLAESAYNTGIASACLLLIIAFPSFVGISFKFFRMDRMYMLFYSIALAVLAIMAFYSVATIVPAMDAVKSAQYGRDLNSHVSQWINNTYTHCCGGVPPQVLTSSCFVAHYLSPPHCATSSSFFPRFQSVINGQLSPVVALFATLGVIMCLVFAGTVIIIVYYADHLEPPHDEAKSFLWAQLPVSSGPQQASGGF